MRDPKRIKEIISALEECWSEFPDLRFGQLVSNINDAYRGGDIFFPEDDKWLEWINQFKDEFGSNYISK